jgi:hypothetical protein
MRRRFKVLIQSKLVFYMSTIFVLGLILIIQGSIPFMTMPTLGQALWSTGFAQSMANNSLFIPYANNFGYPHPAPMVFGLAGGFPTSVFIRLGIYPADAYTLMTAMYFTIAFFGAWKLSRFFSLNKYLSLLSAMLWMILPIIWKHASYSMVSLSMALMPTYLFMTFSLLSKNSQYKRQALEYFLITLLSVFMDGYTFIMFGVASSFILFSYYFNPKVAHHQTFYKLLIHFGSFLISYIIFAIYVGKASFEPSGIEIFRSWGMDLAFFFLPTQGVHWFWDSINTSFERNEILYYGDESIWNTTFCLPLILGTMVLFKRNHLHSNIVKVLIAIAVFALYFALGPSLKINTMKIDQPESVQIISSSEDFLPTGSYFISRIIPGFSNMRATYRWITLVFVAFWLILIIKLSASKHRHGTANNVFILLLLILFYVPNLWARYNESANFYKQFHSIEEELITEMTPQRIPKSKVVFLPWQNDFMVNYLASRLNVRTYNIGGDKNLNLAQTYWPASIRHAPMGRIDELFSQRIHYLLLSDEVDTVIIPHFDTLEDAHDWDGDQQLLVQVPADVITELNAYSDLKVEVKKYFTYIHRVDLGQINQDEPTSINKCFPPACLQIHKFSELYTLSQTGAISDNIIRSNQKAGFLLFGPYVPMNQGKYTLNMYGNLISISELRVEIVSTEGTLYHHVQRDFPTIESTDNIILQIPVLLESTVDDLQIRVFVGSEDEIEIYGYSLIPEN